MASYVDSYGVCNWFPEHGALLVAEEDRDAFAALPPAGKVFHCTGTQDGWLVLEYGASAYRASPDVFKPVAAPIFKVGHSVIAGEKTGIVEHVNWHFKDEAHVYLLTFDGKRSSRRYSGEELKPAV